MVALRLCGSCGRDLDPHAVYCDKCGLKLHEVQQSPREIEDSMKKSLALSGSPVAVKVLNSLEELPTGLEEIDLPHRHCEMIQRARIQGLTFYAPLSKQQCKVAAVALGLMNPTEELRKHQLDELLHTRHRFKREDLLWRFVENTARVPGQHAAVLYGPLGSFPIEPDSVVLICNPIQAMKILQAYQHFTGRRTGASVGGLFSLCADAVATPISTGDLNIAIGCEGARKHGGLRPNELAVGFPFSIANELREASLTLARYEKAGEKHHAS